jgi:hypothetical protein
MSDLNSIDALMSLDPLDLSDKDIEAIIAYQRKARANLEAGIKPRRGTSERAKIDLDSVITSLTGGVPKPKVERRF